MNLYENLNKFVQDKTEKFVQDICKELRKNLKAYATGDLRKSIGYVKEGNSFIIHFLSYGIIVDQGRKPGKFPPPAAIRDWCETMGIDKNFAYPIGKTIKEEGIYGRKWLYYKDKSMDEILDILNKILYDEMTVEILEI